MEGAWTIVVDAIGPGRLVRVLGANLWLFWVGWPSLVEGGMNRLTAGLSAMYALLLLALTADRPRGASGLGGRLRKIRRELDLPALLVGAPALLATTLTARDQAVNAQAFGADPAAIAALILAALSYVAFGAAVLHGDAMRTPVSAAVSTPLGGAHPSTPAAGAARGTQAKTLGFVVGAAGVALVAPHLGGYEALVDRWLDGAAAGAVLTAVVGGSLGAAIAGVFLAGSLRAAATRGTPGRKRGRTALLYLLVAVAATALYRSLGD